MSEALSVRTPRDDSPESIAPHRGHQIGRYCVLGEIGSGGMGVVYGAFDPELNRKVALKLLRSGGDARRNAIARARLQREAQTLAQLSHPNVVKVYDVGRVGEQLFVAMELIEGSDLRTWLRAAPRPWTESVPMFVAAGRGLAAAHALSLVHRDFKPSNVLVDRAGRVSVSDFGLARMDSTAQSATPARDDHRASSDGASSDAGMHAAALAIRSATGPAPDDSLTQRGRTVGTPAYMSPEQHAGHAATPRSDQYSFCVALFEALYAERPFAGHNPRWLAMSKREGLQTPLRPRDRTGRRIPRHVRRVLRRGLQVDPKLRYPSLSALLTALAPEPRRSRHVALALATIAATVGATRAWLAPGAPPTPCADARALVDGAWNEAMGKATTDALEATALPYAERTARKVVEALDLRAQQWVDTHNRACEATWVHGEQSQQALELRMPCLGEQRQTIAATARLLVHADAATVEHAAAMVVALPNPSRCDDAAAVVEERGRPPRGLEVARVEGVREALVGVQALRRAGRHQDARVQMAALAASSDDVAHGPTVTDLLLTEAGLADDAGEFDNAVAVLQRAAATARECRYTRGEAIAWIELLRVTGSHLHDPEQGRFFADLALATIATLRAPAGLRARVLSELGELELRTGQHESAENHLTEALRLIEDIHGERHVEVGETLGRLAGVQFRQGDIGAARASVTRTIEIYEEALGRDHPRMAASLGNLGLLSSAAGDDDAALRHLRSGRSILEATYGAEHPAVANAHDSIGEVLARLHEPAAAKREFARALAVFGATVGAEHPANAAPLLGLGQAELALRQRDAAIAHLEAAHAITLRESLPASQRAETALALADALADDSDQRVLGLLRSVEETYATFLPPDDPQRGAVQRRLASQRSRWDVEAVVGR